MRKFMEAVARKRTTAEVSYPLKTIFSRQDDGGEQDVIRLGNELITNDPTKVNKFRRSELVKVLDLDTGRFVVGYARGCGSERQFKTTVALNYDQRLQLGIAEQKATEKNLVVTRANLVEKEIFFTWTQSDLRDRVNHKHVLIALALGVIGFIPTAQSWITSFISLFQ